MEAVAVAAELRSADEVAIAAIGLEALVSKAGYALALGVRRTAGRCVGLRVVVLAGPGLNGADGQQRRCFENSARPCRWSRSGRLSFRHAMSLLTPPSAQGAAGRLHHRN